MNSVVMWLCSDQSAFCVGEILLLPFLLRLKSISSGAGAFVRFVGVGAHQ